jgi:20S proteasome alpha/beta subunit
MVEMYVKDMPEKFATREGFNLGFTIVGYYNGHPQIHYLQSSHSYSPDIKHDYYIAGIPSIGDYWIMKSWKHLFDDSLGEVKPKLSVKTLKTLTVMLINETAKLNGSVGGKINMLVICNDGTIHHVKQQELAEIKRRVMSIMDEKTLLEIMSKTG